jgi:hypothetical protein
MDDEALLQHARAALADRRLNIKSQKVRLARHPATTETQRLQLGFTFWHIKPGTGLFISF